MKIRTAQTGPRPSIPNPNAPASKPTSNPTIGAPKDAFQTTAVDVVHRSEFTKLEQIARTSLNANIHSLGGKSYVSAGKNQFKSLWTRDFAWSSRGLIAAGRADVVRDQVQALLDNERGSDGLLPRTLDSMDPKKRVLLASVARVLPFINKEQPLTDKLHPEYQDQHGQIAIDGNVLVVLTALDYVQATGDTAFWTKNEAKLQKAFSFYSQHLKDGLVQQPEFSDWQDSVKREGATFYTNLLYQMALQRLEGKPGFGVTHEMVVAHQQKLESTFFDSKTGLYRSMQGREAISLDGNLLAIELGYLPKDGSKAKALYSSLTKSELFTRNGTPGFNTYPDYPADWRNPGVKLVGLGHYHDSIQWSWLMAMAAKVSNDMGDTESARKTLQKLESLAVRDGAIGEIYTGDEAARPWKSLLYRSEEPFTWGAAMAVYATSTLG